MLDGAGRGARRVDLDALPVRCRRSTRARRSTLMLDGAGRGARRVARLDVRTWTALPARCRRSTRARRSTCSAARRADLDALSDLSSPRADLDALPARRSTRATRSTLMLDGAGRGARRVARLDVRTWTALPARCRRSTRARRSTLMLDGAGRGARRVDLDALPARCRRSTRARRSTLMLDGAGRGARRVARLDVRTWTALPARCRRSTRARRSTCSAARRVDLDALSDLSSPRADLDALPARRSTLMLDGAGRGARRVARLDVWTWTRSRPGARRGPGARRADLDALSDLSSPRCGPGRARQVLTRSPGAHALARRSRARR